MKSDLAVAVILLKLLLNLNFVNSLIRRDYSVHAGKNITIPCIKSVSDTILWTRDGNNISSNLNDDNSLVFIDVTSNEAGLYICSVLKNSSSDTQTSYQPHMQAQIKVKTRPGAVGSFRARATTIIAVLIWEVWRNRTGNTPIIDFTAEMRKQPEIFPNNTEENVEWQRLDPQHIAPNARQLEVYHLVPNTSYQFRIWASNEVGSGEIYTISTRTVAPVEEKDLIMRILEDAKEFKKEYWIIAVGIEDESDKDLVQNMHVILNPGFCHDDDQNRPLSPIKTHFYGYGNHYNDDYEKDMTFSRKMSIFFTGNTIKRI
ncbi:contactin-1a isoform X3 [Chironomus tepperi]|uniref:contactin-1a isoform X3 n=1 Tax=Chironomus tepperi TaxID=113505 RepID=UPI00391F3A06